MTGDFDVLVVGLRTYCGQWVLGEANESYVTDHVKISVE